MTENKVCIECPYCKQIIEIDLSEHDKDIKTDVLKEYMLKDCNSCENHLKEQIRADAIEEFVSLFDEWLYEEYGKHVTEDDLVYRVAEQLKKRKLNT